MKLILEVACGIVLGRLFIGFFESPALFEAAKLWLKLLYIGVMIPVTCIKWVLKGTSAVCRWIDAPRKRYGLTLSAYYIGLAVPTLAGFLIPCDLFMVQNAPVSSLDHPTLVNVLAIIADFSMLASILLGLSCAVAYRRGEGEENALEPNRQDLAAQRNWPW